MKTKEEAIEAMKTVEDPELGIDVWTLGLIYELEIKDDKPAIKMTFTTPTCPYAPQLVKEIKEKLIKAGFKEPEIEFVFNPPWEPNEEVKFLLGIA